MIALSDKYNIEDVSKNVHLLLSTPVFKWSASPCHTWASYQVRKIAGCACAGNARNVFPAIDLNGHRCLAIPALITARTWPLSDKKSVGLLSNSGNVRTMMVAGIASPRYQGNRSWNSRRMRNPQFYVSGKRPTVNTEAVEAVIT